MMAGIWFDDVPVFTVPRNRRPYYGNRRGYYEWPIDPMDYLRSSYTPRRNYRERYMPDYLNLGFIPKGSLTDESEHDHHGDCAGDRGNCCFDQLVGRCPCQGTHRQDSRSSNNSKEDEDAAQPWEPLRTLHELIKNHIQRDDQGDHDGERQFQVKIDARGFRPDEIDVKVVNNDLMLVQGQHKVETENGFEHRMIKKCVSLPKNVDRQAIVSKLNKHGFLMIQAPMQKNEAAAITEKQNAAGEKHGAQQEENQDRPTTSESQADDAKIDKEPECKSCAAKEFEIQFDTAGFKPDEINLKVVNNVLMITAQHSTEDDSQFRLIRRCINLPKNIDQDDLKSRLSKDGLLTIKAPLKNITSNVRELKMEVEDEGERSTQDGAAVEESKTADAQPQQNPATVKAENEEKADVAKNTSESS